MNIMNSEQQKIIQQLAELGDVTFVKRGVTSLVNAISEMDSKSLELILEDNVSYQDTTKTIFLKKLEDVFKEFKKEDKKLIAYQGKCNSSECSNKIKIGFSFVGNKSGRYINFIIEENEDGSLKDIYSCSVFCTAEKINILKKDYINIELLNKKNEAQNISVTHEKLNELDERLIKMQNSFLNPNDDFGTLKKGVVLDNLTYDYEITDNDNNNFTII